MTTTQPPQDTGRSGPGGVLAQVVFADCRAPGPLTTSPGWKVKDVAVAPGARAPERRTLEAVEQVAQVHHADVALAGAGRSGEAVGVLKQVRLDGETMLLANFADAGLDRTGRASHTVHGIVHEGRLVAADGASRRPVELADSPMWLRPVGQDAVERLAVAGHPFDLPRGPLDLDALAGDAFLTDIDHPERIDALPVILEGFRSSVQDGTTLVLAGGAADEPVRWLGLLQQLLDPGSAARLRFSTREDLHDVRPGDLQVVGVPAAAGLRGVLPDPLDPRLLVVDLTAPPLPGPDGRWTLPGRDDHRSTLQRSLWTDVAEVVLSSPRTARTIRRALDDLAATAGDAVVAAPLWALPLATLVAGVATVSPRTLLGAVLWQWPDVPGAADTAADAVARHLRELRAADPAGAAALGPGLSRGVPPRLADEVLEGWARPVLAEPGALGARGPRPARAMSATTAADLGRDLPELVGWLADAGVAPIERAGALVRVWSTAAGLGVTDDELATALRPHVDPLVAVVTDPGVDPVAAGVAPPSPGLWTGLLAPALDARLEQVDPDTAPAAVSDAAQRWLDPVLGERDRPQVAAEQHRLELSGYGWSRAERGPVGDDPWALAVTAAARRRALTRSGCSGTEAATAALDSTFGERPPPPDVTHALLDDLPADDVDAALVVATRCLLGSDGGPQHRAVADAMWARLGAAGEEGRPEAGVVYLHVVLDAIGEGGGDAAADPGVCAAAEYVAASVLPSLPESRIRDVGWSVVVGWLLRLPLASLRVAVETGDDATRETTTYGAFVSGLLGAEPQPGVVDAALDTVLRHLDVVAARRVLANLVVRAGLVFLDWQLPARDEPLVSYLRMVAPGNVSRFLREPVAGWLETQPPTEIEELRRAVGDVIYGLADLGWGPEEIRYLEEDREQLFAMLHSRSLLGRVRSPR